MCQGIGFSVNQLITCPETMASGSSCKREAKIFAASGGAWPDPAMRMTIMNWDFDSCSQTLDSPSYGGVVLGSFGGFDFCWSFRLSELT